MKYSPSTLAIERNLSQHRIRH